MILTRQTMNV